MPDTDVGGVPLAPPETQPLAIEIRGLTKAYRLGDRTVDALRGLDLTVRDPGFVAVMGPSGSGKSTLLHLLAGLDRGDGGSINVAGTRVDRLSEGELTLYRRKRIGVVFQQFNLLPTLTALENVILPGILDGQDRGAMRERGLLLLRELGLEARAEHRPDALSGGEQQRVAIARSLLFEPPVLLADEPTGNLDSATSERLWEMLDTIARARSLLVLLVTHEPSAAAHCRAVHVLRDGRLAGSFDVDGIPASELALRAAELGRTTR